MRRCLFVDVRQQHLRHGSSEVWKHTACCWSWDGVVDRDVASPTSAALPCYWRSAPIVELPRCRRYGMLYSAPLPHQSHRVECQETVLQTTFHILTTICYAICKYTIPWAGVGVAVRPIWWLINTACDFQWSLFSFLANVNSCSHSLYAVTLPSVAHPSVCHL